MKNIVDPFANLVLDGDEQALEDAFERGEFETLPHLEETRKMLQEAAKHHKLLHTAKPVTLRINQLDLIKIKAKAKRHNIPYQTLLGVVLHDFADDKKEITLR